MGSGDTGDTTNAGVLDIRLFVVRVFSTRVFAAKVSAVRVSTVVRVFRVSRVFWVFFIRVFVSRVSVTGVRSSLKADLFDVSIWWLSADLFPRPRAMTISGFSCPCKT